MIKKLLASPESLVWCGVFSILLIISLRGPAMRTPPAADTTPRAQPILLQMAVGHPQERVDVIVQKQSTAKAVEELVVQLGGVVTRDLPIINAFTAQLPAKAVPQLARTSGVRWVSLNAPVGGIRDD